MTQLNLNNWNSFKDVDSIKADGIAGSDSTYTILTKSGKVHKFFIPSNKVIYDTELLLSYYVHAKLNELHEKNKLNNIILFKNFNSYLDLIKFDHRDKLYDFTSYIETCKVSDDILSEVKNLVIELNLDLRKLNYLHS